MIDQLVIKDLEFLFHIHYENPNKEEISIGVYSRKLDCNMAMVLNIGEEAAQKIRDAFSSLEKFASYEFACLKKESKNENT